MPAPGNSEGTTRHRRHAASTKARILEAAKDLFAAKGFGRTALREVAAAAGVAVSLVPQHFGSKAGLFEAALFDAMADYTVLQTPREGWGREMVDLVCGDGDVRLPAMVILSTGDVEARDLTARILREHIIPRLAKLLGPPDASARALQITMLATGLLLYTRQMPIGLLDERQKAQYGALLQLIVDGGEGLSVQSQHVLTQT